MHTSHIQNTSSRVSDHAKAQLASIQFVDAGLQRVNALSPALQTERIAYSPNTERSTAEQTRVKFLIVIGLRKLALSVATQRKNIH
jgi:hypothetical protein